MFSFFKDGHQECCGARKVKPLRKKLSTLDAWCDPPSELLLWSTPLEWRGDIERAHWTDVRVRQGDWCARRPERDSLGCAQGAA